MTLIKKASFGILLFLVQLLSYNAKAQEGQNSLLWKISGNGLEQPSYLFGTIHMICKSDYFMLPQVQKALKESKEFYGELNFADIQEMKKMQEMIKSETPLSQRISSDQYQIAAKLLKSNLNIDIEEFENMSDLGILSTITYKSFPCKDIKMYEIELLQMAAGKKTGGLETVAEQAEIMSSMAGIDTIIQMLQDLNDKDQNLTAKMVEVYKKQDIQEMIKIMNKTSYMDTDNYDLLLSNRNHRWIEKMPAIMKKQSTFFAVGAGHLAGETGVLNLLKLQGYTIEPVTK